MGNRNKKDSIKGQAEDVPRPSVKLSDSEDVGTLVRSPLGIYLTFNKITTSAFCKATGAQFKTIRDAAAGILVPNLVLAYEIERITKGAVPMESWIAMGAAKRMLVKLRSYQPDEIQNMPAEERGGGMALPVARKEEARKIVKHRKEKEEKRLKETEALDAEYDEIGEAEDDNEQV